MRTTPASVRMDPLALVAALVALVGAPIIGMVVTDSPQITLLAIAAAAGGLVLLRHPHWCAYLLAAATFFNTYLLDAGFAQLGPADLASVITLAIWPLHRLAQSDRVRLPQGSAFFAGYLALAFASALLSIDQGTGVSRFIRSLAYMGAMLAVVDLVRDRETWRRMIWILVLGATVHAVAALILAGESLRLMGLVGQSNRLGHYCALGAFLALLLYRGAERRSTRALLLVSVAVMAVVIVLTISRGTQAASGLALLWMVRRDRLKVAGLLFALAAVTFAGATFEQRRADRIVERWELEDSSVRLRMKTMENGLEVIQERPFFGVGFGQYDELKQVIDVTAARGGGAHNYYVAIAASSGVPALAALLAFLAANGRQLMVLRRRAEASADEAARAAAALLSGMEVFMLYGLAALITKGGMQIVVWMFIAVIAVAVRNFQQELSSPD